MSIVNMVVCDFCGKRADEIGFYAMGIDDRAHICEECAANLSEAFAEKRAEKEAEDADGSEKVDEAPLVEAEVVE